MTWLNSYQVVLFWQAFLVLTIAGERLELSRVLRPSHRSRFAFAGIASLYAASIIIAIFDLQSGTRVNGAALLLLAL